MCGRYTLIANVEAIRLLFRVTPFDARLVPPRYNIAPTQPIAVVRETERGRELLPMRWGLIPGWAKDPNDVSLLINARADEIAEKPAFRSAVLRRRCLIPASGFYEWQARGSGPRQPYAIRPHTDLIAFAGIFETWCGNDGSEIDTAAIVTTDANDSLKPIHHRMPVVLAAEDFEAWLSADTQLAEALALLAPAPADLFACMPVSTRVNAAANDDPDLWEETTEVEAAALPPRQMRLF